MSEFFISMGYDEWFGLCSLIAVLAFAGVAAYFSYLSAWKAGRQKVAEARLLWSERYKQLSLRLDRILLSLERDMRPGRPTTIFTNRRRLEARTIVTEMLYMINPESDDEAAEDERRMERETLHRLAMVGVGVDMNFVELHRRVMKHNWRRAKGEF